MADSWGDIHTWLSDVGEERVFRMWVFKKMFTPYEQDEKFSDESVYVDDTCKFVMIKELIELPDGDLLIGFQDADSDNLYLEYYKLSEIRLDYCQSDNERLDDDFDEESMIVNYKSKTNISKLGDDDKYDCK